MTMQKHTVFEVISEAYRTQPQLRLATTPKQDVIGSWSPSEQRFVVVACLAITGHWVSMPYELLVNGERIAHEWQEVPNA
jgi:hypothetical protein